MSMPKKIFRPQNLGIKPLTPGPLGYRTPTGFPHHPRVSSVMSRGRWERPSEGRHWCPAENAFSAR